MKLLHRLRKNEAFREALVGKDVDRAAIRAREHAENIVEAAAEEHWTGLPAGSEEWPGFVSPVRRVGDTLVEVHLAAGQLPPLPEGTLRLRFPFGVAGYLEPWEGQALYALATQTPAAAAIVELGSYKGRSTICLASSGRWVLAVDTFAGEPELAENPVAHADHVAGTYEEAFDANVERWGCAENVTKHRGDTHGGGAEDAFRALDAVSAPVWLVFVDAAHDYESVKADAAWWGPVLQPGGVMAFDDASHDPVHQVIEEFLAEGWERVGQWGAVRAIRKAR